MFDGKVVVITGAGSGIGRALALQFARAGARLALSSQSKPGLDGTLRLLPPGCEARDYIVDVSDCEAVFAHAEDVQRDFGAAHIVVNNAGATVIGTVEHLSIEEFRWQIDVNLYGVLYGTKAFLPMMLAQREGRIVNISSNFGVIGFPAQGAYNMSKFAVRGLTECLWSELDGTGVQAVLVQPGGIRTNIDKAGRRAKAAGAQETRFDAMAEKALRTPPEECAADILEGLRRGKRRILTGFGSSTVFWMSRLFPDVYPALLKRGREWAQR